MKYLSVCSGIEAASVAWHQLGWEPVGFSEIESFPCSVLAERYPNVPNLGDMTKYKEWKIERPNALVGGTPCQSFSVAGLRRGLEDPRGNLMLTFGAIAGHFKPTWIVWENVPGVLSSNGGRDFGSFLWMLGELGYGFAYRVLDAQYFGVAQRRRRVFVVGYLGDWRRASAVLFESESLCWYPPPSRETGKGSARGSTFGIDEECNATEDGFGPLLRGGQGGTRQAVAYGVPFAFEPRTPDGYARVTGGIAPTLNRMGGGQREPCVAMTLNAKGGSGRLDSESKTLLTVGFNARQDPDSWNDRTGPLDTDGGTQAVAFAQNSRDEVREMAVVGALAAKPGMKQTSYLRQNMGVRRLTPRECERLQGFPDDYTLIHNHKGKWAKDGPRYKALGNSMAVPVMRWIGERIETANRVFDGVKP